MNHHDLLLKELNSILSKPHSSWGPMTIPRIQKIIGELAETLKAMSSVIKDQAKTVKFVKGIRKDMKLDRNSKIFELYKQGAKQSALAVEFRLTRQRVNTIIKTQIANQRTTDDAT